MTRKNNGMHSPHSTSAFAGDPTGPTASLSLPGLESIERLSCGSENDVLEFLAERPVHTIIMSGLIHDNGLESPLNRGNFYGYRGRQGNLEGVALIGHATVVEARSDAALAAFARLAGRLPGINIILGEQERIERFWGYYSERSRAPHYRRRELLFEQRWPSPNPRIVPALRLATMDDFDLVVTSHARMGEEELGVNLLAADPDGFRERCARRIRQGRVWLWIKHRRLIFKADIIAETSEASYLEGVYVDPAERGNGYGSRCLAQVSRRLLARTPALCLLVSEDNRVAQGLSRKAGYTVTACYETIFFRNRPGTGILQSKPVAPFRWQGAFRP